MTDSLYSPYWYRVAELKPRLRSHVQVSRHLYRGQRWYVLIDTASGRYHRFNDNAYYFISRMDGVRTIQEIWNGATAALGDKAPTQDETIMLLGQLHNADLMQCNILPNLIELFQRQEKQHGKIMKQRVSNPFALRIPLFDPDKFLTRWSFLVEPFLGKTAFFLWLIMVTGASLLAAVHWPDFSENIKDRILVPHNLLFLWLAYPIVKLLHELGHAFAVRKWGGEVHEMGIMLLALTPVPYVNASASSAFQSKKQRMAVAGMGIAVELAIASLALLVWLNVEQGLVHTMAFNIMLIGSVSTVLFNGNPLLRYDGYYILSDAIEIPNLSQRSIRYLGYLVKHYLFGIEDVSSPVTAPGEKSWFFLYGIVSFLYRMSVVAGLVLFIGGKFFFIGVLIGFWAIFSLVVIPLIRISSDFLNSPGYRKKHARIIGVSLLATSAAAIVLLILPVPFGTSAQGIVWMPEQSHIRALTDCVVLEMFVQNNQQVDKNDLLVTCEDPLLEAEAAMVKARLEEHYATYNAEPQHARVKRDILREQIETLKADLARANEKLAALSIRSPASGTFVLTEPAANLPGRFIRQGGLIGYVISEARPVVRTVVPQSEMSLISEGTKAVAIRLATHPHETFASKIERVVPSAGIYLPSRALGTKGGGNIPVDPTDPDGIRVLENIFQLDLSLPPQNPPANIGGRVYARFEHGTMPLAFQWYRSLRLLFLRRFDV